MLFGGCTSNLINLIDVARVVTAIMRLIRLNFTFVHCFASSSLPHNDFSMEFNSICFEML